MKKNIFYTFALALALTLAFGVSSAQAQTTYEDPTLNPEYVEIAQQIANMQLEDPEGAINMMEKKLYRKIRNKQDQLVAAGRFFLQNNMYPYAKMCSDRAYELDAANVPSLMLFGEVCMMRKDYGSAGSKFDEIWLLDSTYIPALKLSARVYKYVNPIVAQEKLHAIKRVEPENYEADKELGDIAYSMSDYEDAAKYYTDYVKRAPAEEVKVGTSENYAMSLYGAHRNQEALDYSQKMLEKYADNLIFKRMVFYSACALKDEFTAVSAMGYIDNKEYEDSLYMYQDYMFAGTIMKSNNVYSKAVTYFEKAVEKDATKAIGFKELASAYSGNKQYVPAIDSYKKYLEMTGDAAQATDYMQFGVYYNLAAQDTLDANRMTYVQEGDAAFGKVIELAPNSYQGYQWRARINNTDATKTNDMVRDWYIKTIEIAADNANAKAAKLEGYQYLAWYAIQTDDNEGALKYAEEMLVLDPTNGMALQIKKILGPQDAPAE